MKTAFANTVLFLVGFPLGYLLGCAAPMSTPTTADKVVFAETTYAAQLQACVHDNATAGAIDACAARVRARWAPDGGAK